MSNYLGIVLTAFGILFIYLQWLVPLRKMRKELFNEFNERYMKLSDGLQDISDKFKNNPEIQTTQLSKEQRNLLITYFNLCAEEYYWYKRVKLGGIDKTI